MSGKISSLNFLSFLTHRVSGEKEKLIKTMNKIVDIKENAEFPEIRFEVDTLRLSW